MRILVIEDKLGITHGYQTPWKRMCMQAGLPPENMVHYSLHKAFPEKRLLEKYGNALQPFYARKYERLIQEALEEQLERHRPDLILCQDSAALAALGLERSTCTIDKLRGGVYSMWGFPCLVLYPISAINTHATKKDSILLNNAADKDEWEAIRRQDAEDIYIPPYSVPSGKWTLQMDLLKAKRLLGKIKAGQNIIPAPALDRVTICDTPAKLEEARQFLLDSKLIANDVETWPELQLMSVNGYAGVKEDGEMRAFVFPFTEQRSPHSEPPDTWEAAYRIMREVNMSGIPFIYHNGVYDLFWLTRYRMPVKNFAYDSMILWWSMFPELEKGLGFVSSILVDSYQYWKGDGKALSQRVYLEYNALDNLRTLECVLRLGPVVADDPKARENFRAAMRRAHVCLQMSLWGLRVDEGVLANLRGALQVEAEEALERLRYLVADPEFNFRSPKQMKHLFYSILGAQPRNAKGRKIRNASAGSTGQEVQKYLKEEGPLQRIIVEAIQAAMAPAKQISNVIEMPRKWGRVWTGYNPIGTTTSRLSSSSSPIGLGSNLQNIRKQYRHWIVPDNKDSIFIEVDFSASDDVFVAFESADPEKIKLFRSGKDAHSTNVALLFKNWTYEQVVAGKKAGDPRVVHPETGIRQGIKRVAHGCNYLMAETTLLQSIGINAVKAAAIEYGHEDAHTWGFGKMKDFCGELEAAYRAHYARLSNPGTPGSWYNDLLAEVKETGGFTTPFNYFQRFLSDPESHAVLRAVAATAGQAGTAGRINMVADELVHGYIPPTFRDAPNPHANHTPLRIGHHLNGVRIVLQTHDSYTFHVNRAHPQWKEGVRNVLTSMTRPVVIRNKLTGELEEFSIGIEVEAGHAWGKGLEEVDHTADSFFDRLAGL